MSFLRTWSPRDARTSGSTTMRTERQAEINVGVAEAITPVLLCTLHEIKRERGPSKYSRLPLRKSTELPGKIGPISDGSLLYVT